METEIDKINTNSNEIINSAKTNEEIGATSFMKPKEPKIPGKKGRPLGSKKDPKADSIKADQKNEPPKTAAFNIPTATLCIPLTKAVSTFGVNLTKDARAQLTSDEIDQMASSMGMVIDKYMPDAMTKYGPELMLGFSLGSYGLRLYAIKRLQEEQFRRQNMTNEHKPDQQNNTSPLYKTEKAPVSEVRGFNALVDTDSLSPVP